MTVTQTRRLWIAYGPAGAVGSIRQDDAGYGVKMARQDHPIGIFPALDVAKNALVAQLRPGSDRPEFREH